MCIYQEYILNKNKAKGNRKNYLCTIFKKEQIEEGLYIFTVNAPHSLVHDLVYPGSFVFIRKPECTNYYDTPISIMEADAEKNILKMAIEIKGVKTKSICELNENEKMLIKGPFWNGILGLKNIYNLKDGVSVVIGKGIGIAPLIPVLKKLYSNENKVISIIDRTPFNDVFGKEYFQMCNSEILQCNILEKGELTKEFKMMIEQILKVESVNLIHCSGPDILISKIMEFAGESINFSACNNSKMCCGEGVCGACSTRYKNHVIKKLCKVQLDPKHLFKDRRLI